MKNYIGPRSLKANAKNKERIEKLLNKPSLSSLKKKLQDTFNLFIRLRDTRYSNGTQFFVCISCNQAKPLNQMNAGHLYPVGSNEAIRYDEDNCWGQCIACNLHKHGNQLAFYKNVVLKIGQSRVDLLDLRRNSLAKFMPFEL